LRDTLESWRRGNGYAEVPVMVARGWTDAQKRAYVIADNQLALNAGWDRVKRPVRPRLVLAALLHGSVIWRRGVEGIGGWARS
jgi:hypothetical protein